MANQKINLEEKSISPTRRRHLHLACAALLGLTAAAAPLASAMAQAAFPAKPIRLIVPFPPGGGTDMIARTVAQKVADTNKWNIVVDNRPGAGGNLGVDAAAKATPDGITLGYSGNGTVAHLAGTLATKAAGIDLRNVPYKGAAQAMTDLVGGNIDLYMSAVPTLIGQVRNGKLRPVVVTSLKRSSQLPDTPTLDELGYKGFDAVSWFGVLAPVGTPDAIVQQLNKAINAALQQPDVIEKLRTEGGDVLGGSSEKFKELLRAEVPRWAKIVKDSGASLD